MLRGVWFLGENRRPGWSPHLIVGNAQESVKITPKFRVIFLKKCEKKRSHFCIAVQKAMTRHDICRKYAGFGRQRALLATHILQSFPILNRGKLYSDALIEMPDYPAAHIRDPQNGTNSWPYS